MQTIQPRKDKATPDNRPEALEVPVYNEMTDAVLGTNRIMAKGTVEIGKAILDAASGQLRANVEVFQNLSECSNPAELLTRQWAYTNTAAQRYLEDASKLMGMWAHLLEEGSASFQKIRP
jgi:hypothetical protein